MEKMNRAEYLELRKAQAIEIATKILNGKIELLEGVVALQMPLSELGLNKDERFSALRAIASDVDELPLGKVRELWAPQALVEKDVEIKKTGDFYRETILSQCAQLVGALKEV